MEWRPTRGSGDRGGFDRRWDFNGRRWGTGDGELGWDHAACPPMLVERRVRFRGEHEREAGGLKFRNCAPAGSG